MIFQDSRYESADVLPVPDSAGVYHATVEPARALPASTTFTSYTTRVGDRLDLLAQTAYGDPEMWWVIADANPGVFYPDELPAGIVVAVPVAAS